MRNKLSAGGTESTLVILGCGSFSANKANLFNLLTLWNLFWQFLDDIPNEKMIKPWALWL